jgi:hypothetical protein
VEEVVTTWPDCRAVLAEQVKALTLPDLAPERVYEHLSARPLNVTLPCVELTLAGLMESWKWYTTDHLLWTYPVGLLVLFRGDPGDPTKEGPYLLWRDQIASALPPWKPQLEGIHRVRVEPAGNVTGGFRARAEPGQVRDPLGPAWLKVAGALVVTFEIVKKRVTG